MNRFLFVILLFLVLTPVSAQAQCENPHAQMGVIIFNKAHKVMQYCNGDVWVGLWGRGGEVDLDNLNASNLTSGTVPMERIGFGTADDTTFLRGDGQWATVVGTPPTCAGADKALQWDGSAWSCATIESGGATMDLVNGQHSSAQCTGIGGTVVTQGSVKMCGFNATACPAGWARYQNWAIFAAKTCSGTLQWTQCTALTCTTPARGWTNDATAPTCTHHAGPMDWGVCHTAVCSGTLTHIACY